MNALAHVNGAAQRSRQAFAAAPADASSRTAEALTDLLRRQLPAEVMALLTPIRGDDGACLTARERLTLASHLPSREAASGAARRAARVLCSRAGVALPEIPRSPRGRPVWPPPLAGSLAHDAAFAAAAIGSSLSFGGIGIDVEPPEPLPAHVGRFLASEAERRQFAPYPFGDKALFSIKEAVFKSISTEHAPLLDFQDITVDVRRHIARMPGRRIVRWCLITDALIVAVAWWWRPGGAGFAAG